MIMFYFHFTGANHILIEGISIYLKFLFGSRAAAVVSLTDKILFWDWHSLTSTLGEKVQYIVDGADRGHNEKRNKT